ncbi:hypothetical protein EAI_17442 [Harpegnathos saltator]|uniref:Uncharacterized protein n=1 Tax=Harpegnathos saltator TaxID=610380 RepID=E2C092_HARSA|nr:hypothetical protein EAI_17442 [Harpegnathos saltator]
MTDANLFTYSALLDVTMLSNNANYTYLEFDETYRKQLQIAGGIAAHGAQQTEKTFGDKRKLVNRYSLVRSHYTVLLARFTSVRYILVLKLYLELVICIILSRKANITAPRYTRISKLLAEPSPCPKRDMFPPTIKIWLTPKLTIKYSEIICIGISADIRRRISLLELEFAAAESTENRISLALTSCYYEIGHNGATGGISRITCETRTGDLLETALPTAGTEACCTRCLQKPVSIALGDGAHSSSVPMHKPRIPVK